MASVFLSKKNSKVLHRTWESWESRWKMNAHIGDGKHVRIQYIVHLGNSVQLSILAKRYTRPNLLV